jgi:hypothetical protein
VLRPYKRRVLGWHRSDQLDESTFAAVFGQQRQDGPIHCHELSFLMHRKSQQIGIGHLLMARRWRSEWFKRLDRAELIAPRICARDGQGWLLCSFTAGNEWIHFRDALGSSRQVTPPGKSRPTNKARKELQTVK